MCDIILSERAVRRQRQDGDEDVGCEYDLIQRKCDVERCDDHSLSHSLSLNFLTYLSDIVICLNRVTIHPLDVKIHPTEQVIKVHLMRI